MLNADGSRTFDRALSEAIVAEHRAMVSARLADEGARLARVKAEAAPPAVCGPAIPVAPARGDLTTFRPMELVPGTVGVARDTGHWERGEVSRRRGARIKDVFDRMEEEARQTHRARGDKAGPYVPPLSPAQVQIGRDYRDMVERHASGGVKCASLEALGRQGGGSGAFSQAFAHEGRRIEAMRFRIGKGAALAIRRIRPSKRGGAGRSAIFDRRLVDLVCLMDMDPGRVLELHGWAAYGQTREALRSALAGALDRMMGYRDGETQDGA